MPATLPATSGSSSTRRIREGPARASPGAVKVTMTFRSGGRLATGVCGRSRRDHRAGMLSCRPHASFIYIVHEAVGPVPVEVGFEDLVAWGEPVIMPFYPPHARAGRIEPERIEIDAAYEERQEKPAQERE